MVRERFAGWCGNYETSWDGEDGGGLGVVEQFRLAWWEDGEDCRSMSMVFV